MGPKGFTKRDISFAHLSWLYQGSRCSSLSEHELGCLAEGDYAILTPPPSKCDPFGMRWGTKPIWLPFHPTKWLCAARALRDVELHCGGADHERKDTPLLRLPTKQGLPRSYTADLLKLFLRSIMSEEDAKRYTMHSFRAYLCNALDAAGCSDGAIQAMLRWASADSILTYRETKCEQFARWLDSAAAAVFTAARGATVRLRADGRPMPVIDSTERALEYLNEQFSLAAVADKD